MKIRAGFVSNSSSASFIVAFPAGFKPTKESIERYLFGGHYISPGRHWDNKTPITTPELVEHIYAQMRRRKPNSRPLIARVMSDWTAHPPLYGVAHERAKAVFWAAEQARLTKGGRSDLYTFSFSSEVDAVDNELKSGRPFDAVPYLRTFGG
jgi:hypothetical protein